MMYTEYVCVYLYLYVNDAIDPEFCYGISIILLSPCNFLYNFYVLIHFSGIFTFLELR